MSFLHVGNLANFPYRQVMALRRKGFDAQILIPLIHDFTEDPRSEDPELFKSGFPSWIHFWDNRHPLRKLHLMRTLREYDFVHAYTEFPIAAVFSLKPYIAQSTGSDLRELAVQNTYKGFLLRQAYRRSKMLLFGNPDQLKIIAKLRLKKTRFSPNPIDMDKYSPRKEETLRGRYPCEVLIFHPTALEWRLKGNDLLLRAYARLVREVKDVLLLLSGRGVDLERTKILLNKLGVEQYVEFLPLLDQQELIKYYNASDIVLDQFIIGSIGSIALEAMSCAKPVFAYISNEHFRLLYPELPPIVNVRTEDQIYKKLYELTTDEVERRKIGETSRNWVQNYHDSGKVAEKLIQIYNAVMRA